MQIPDKIIITTAIVKNIPKIKINALIVRAKEVNPKLGNIEGRNDQINLKGASVTKKTLSGPSDLAGMGRKRSKRLK